MACYLLRTCSCDKDQMAAELCQKQSMWCNKIEGDERRSGKGKKTLKKEMDNPSFLWRQIDDFWHNFAAIWSLSVLVNLKKSCNFNVPLP